MSYSSFFLFLNVASSQTFILAKYLYVFVILFVPLHVNTHNSSLLLSYKELDIHHYNFVVWISKLFKSKKSIQSTVYHYNLALALLLWVPSTYLEPVYLFLQISPCCLLGEEQTQLPGCAQFGLKVIHFIYLPLHR